jgi:hypothetical protein
MERETRIQELLKLEKRGVLLVAENLNFFSNPYFRSLVEGKEEEKIVQLVEDLLKGGKVGLDLLLPDLPTTLRIVPSLLPFEVPLFIDGCEENWLLNLSSFPYYLIPNSISFPFGEKGKEWLRKRKGVVMGRFPHHPVSLQERIKTAFLIYESSKEEGIPTENILLDPILYPLKKVPDGFPILLNFLKELSPYFSSFFLPLSNLGGGEKKEARKRIALEFLREIIPYLPEGKTYYILLPL